MADVVWHPVSEEPCASWARFVCVQDEDGEGDVTLGWPHWGQGGVYWVNAEDSRLETVTHWAHITYPPAPEVA